MSTITTDLELSICGFDCSQEVTLSYFYDPKCGDGWNEPFQSARVELRSAEVAISDHYPPTVNVLPLLSNECIAKLEAWLVGEHEENAKPDADYLRDVAREWA